MTVMSRMWCTSVFHLYFYSADASKPTIQQLMMELSNNVASEWNLIGTLLGISDGELNMISEQEHHDHQKCLMAMLRVWLHQTNPPASWPEIAKVLELTEKPDIAQQIRQKYCKHISI